MSIPVLSLIPRGCPDHPRFILADLQRGFWTGNSWSDDEHEGLLFATERDAGRVAVEILSAATKDMPVYSFTAPIELEVRSNHPPDLQGLMLWLMRAARLYVDYQQTGLTDGTAMLSIDWTKLVPVKKPDLP